MKHNDKPSQSDTSARLDALLSDFLNKDVVESGQSTRSARATSTPLGDPLLADVVAEPKPLPDALRQTPAQQAFPVTRTDVWEATNKAAPTLSSESSALTNLAADQLEKNVNSILGASATAARGRRLFFGSLAIGSLLVVGLFWRSWKSSVAPPTSEGPAVTVPSSEIDAPPAETTLGTVSASEAHPESSETDVRNPSSHSGRDGRFVVPIQVPTHSARGVVSTVNRTAQSAASAAAKFEQMPAPSLGRSTMNLGTLQNFASIQPAPPSAPLPLPPSPPASPVKDISPDPRTAAAIPAIPVSKVQPVYPELARRMKVTGTVRVAITVNTAGKVTSAKAVDGPAVLRASAEQAVKQWLFSPATMNGKPVIGTGTVSILFNSGTH
jgi:TonB family protein